MTANREYCLQTVKNSLGIATALTPHIGYEKAAEIAQEAYHSGQSVYDLILAQGILSPKELLDLLSPENLIKPQRGQEKSS